ncbi:hypothetical protein AB0454_21335 [Streptomyces sp. NPDC093509]|uniref:TetR/AcrR family transcriptional regulator n=1 Tax=Streptomyces sp. NPDC093509 TaxID=3154982 RepID=UPI00344E0ACC
MFPRRWSATAPSIHRRYGRVQPLAVVVERSEARPLRPEARGHLSADSTPEHRNPRATRRHPLSRTPTSLWTALIGRIPRSGERTRSCELERGIVACRRPRCPTPGRRTRRRPGSPRPVPRPGSRPCRSLGPTLSLVSAQLLGLALTRYIVRIPTVAELSPEQIVATLTPAIQATLGQG